MLVNISMIELMLAIEVLDFVSLLFLLCLRSFVAHFVVDWEVEDDFHELMKDNALEVKGFVHLIDDVESFDSYAADYYKLWYVLGGFELFVDDALVYDLEVA